MKPKKALLQNWNVILLLLIVTVLYSVINWLTPLWCDDLDYGAAGHTLGDITRREVHDYFHANGRLFSHTLVQLFAGIIGKPLFNILNPILTMVMVALLPLAAGEELKAGANKWRWALLLSLSLLLVWFVLPDQYITMFMIAGSSNYIWAAVLNLLFVCVFTQQLTKEQSLKGWQWAYVILLSFFAGAWMEMYSIAFAPALFLYLLLHRKNVNKPLIIAFVCYVVGTAFVVLAPGNFERHGEAVSGHPALVTWIVTQLELAIRFKLIWVWLLSLVLLIIELVKKQTTIKTFFEETLIWLVGIAVSYAFLFVSGVSSYRSQWAIYLFSFVILFSLLRKLQLRNMLCALASIVFLVIIVADFIKECKACSIKKDAVAEMLHQAQTETLTEGNYYLWPESVLTRKSIPIPTGLNGLWPGNSFAAFHHMDRFIIMPKEVYAYCSGSESCDSLYYGILPLVNGKAIAEIDEGTSSLSLAYDYDIPSAYVLRNQPARLLQASGCSEATRKVYNSRGFLLEKEQPLVSVSSVSDAKEGVFVFDFRGKRYLAAPIEMLQPKYEAAIKNVTIVR